MATHESRIDAFVAKVRRNPVIAACIVAGFVVIWVANFTDAVRKLRATWPDAKPAAIAGTWKSGPLRDARTDVEYHYAFDLRNEGTRVLGSARRLMPVCERNPNAGLCAGHGKPVAILDGTIVDKALAFSCDWGELPGAGPWSWVRVKETFKGTVGEKGLRLVVQDDQSAPAVEFEAVLQDGPSVLKS